MSCDSVYDSVHNLQHSMYSKLRDISKDKVWLGRFVAFPVAFIDITLENLVYPLIVIKNVDLFARKLIEITFSYIRLKPVSLNKFKNLLNNMEHVILNTAVIPASLIVAPFMIALQFAKIIKEPKQVKHYRYCSHNHQ